LGGTLQLMFLKNHLFHHRTGDNEVNDDRKK